MKAAIDIQQCRCKVENQIEGRKTNTTTSTNKEDDNGLVQVDLFEKGKMIEGRKTNTTTSTNKEVNNLHYLVHRVQLIEMFVGAPVVPKLAFA